jgi:hypothetical protein
MVCACWRFQRALHFHHHARGLFSFFPHAQISDRLLLIHMEAMHGKCRKTNERLYGLWQ